MEGRFECTCDGAGVTRVAQSVIAAHRLLDALVVDLPPARGGAGTRCIASFGSLAEAEAFRKAMMEEQLITPELLAYGVTSPGFAVTEPRKV